MKNPLLKDKNLSDTIVKKIASIISDIDPKNIEKQLDEFDENTTLEIIYKILNVAFCPENSSISSLRLFLEDKFEYSIIHVSEFYKQLSEKLNSKYSPEELELIFDSEKQLVCSLLRENNDIIETKSNLYNKRYDKDCNLTVSVTLQADIVNTIKQLSTISKLQKTVS